MGKIVAAKQLAKRVTREQLIKQIQSALISTTDASELLRVSVSRLKAMGRFKTVLRGYYFRQDILDYLEDENAQKERQHWKGEHEEKQMSKNQSELLDKLKEHSRQTKKAFGLGEVGRE